MAKKEKPTINVEKYKDSCDKLEEKFSNTRKQWSDEIRSLTAKLSKVKEFADAQAQCLSDRQELVEEMSNLRVKLYKQKMSYEGHESALFRYYILDYDMKMSNTDVRTHIKSDLAQLEYLINLITNQIDFYTETIKTLDNYNFAIKNRIQVVSESLV